MGTWTTGIGRRRLCCVTDTLLSTRIVLDTRHSHGETARTDRSTPGREWPCKQRCRKKPCSLQRQGDQSRRTYLFRSLLLLLRHVREAGGGKRRRKASLSPFPPHALVHLALVPVGPGPVLEAGIEHGLGADRKRRSPAQCLRRVRVARVARVARADSTRFAPAAVGARPGVSVCLSPPPLLPEAAYQGAS